MTQPPDDAAQALAHINEAIRALSIEMYSQPSGEADWVRAPSIQATIAVELERVDSAIGISGNSMFYRLAEKVKQAAIELHAARAALEPSDKGVGPW